MLKPIELVQCWMLFRRKLKLVDNFLWQLSSMIKWHFQHMVWRILVQSHSSSSSAFKEKKNLMNGQWPSAITINNIITASKSLSPSYTPFIATISSTFLPISVIEALFYPYWRKATEEEIGALNIVVQRGLCKYWKWFLRNLCISGET